MKKNIKKSENFSKGKSSPEMKMMKMKIEANLDQASAPTMSLWDRQFSFGHWRVVSVLHLVSHLSMVCSMVFGHWKWEADLAILFYIIIVYYFICVIRMLNQIRSHNVLFMITVTYMVYNINSNDIVWFEYDLLIYYFI